MNKRGLSLCGTTQPFFQTGGVIRKGATNAAGSSGGGGCAAGAPVEDSARGGGRGGGSTGGGLGFTLGSVPGLDYLSELNAGTWTCMHELIFVLVCVCVGICTCVYM